MKGHIRKRGAKWCIVVDIGIEPSTGKRKQKWFSGYRTKKDAQKDLARIVNELEQNIFVVPSDSTIAEFFESWLEQRSANLSATTITGYKSILKNHIVPALGALKLKDIKPLMLSDYYRVKLEVLSGRTVLHHHRLLRKALEDAKRWQLIANNPADNVEVPKAKKYRATILDLSEIKILLEALRGHEMEVAVSLILFLGLRRGELLALSWDDIDWDNKTVHIQKNLVVGDDGPTVKDPKTEESNRVIPISDSIIRLLKKQRVWQNENKMRLGSLYVDSDYIFTKEDGSLFHPGTFSHNFGEFLKASGLKSIRLHDLRHTNASLMLKSNIPAKVASERLGHSNISTTMDIYSQVLKDTEREVSDKIDDMIFSTK